MTGHLIDKLKPDHLTHNPAPFRLDTKHRDLSLASTCPPTRNS